MSLAAGASRTLLLTGGTRSGKSALALRWAEALAAQRVFVATARALDAETAQRVARHQAERGSGWTCCEEPVRLLDVLRRTSQPGIPVVVDCVTMWLTNLLYPPLAAPAAASVPAAADVDAVLACVCEVARWLPLAPGPVALVTAEVGLGIVPASPAGRLFRDLQGEANQILARSCTTVLFVSCGLPLPLKNTIPEELL